MRPPILDPARLGGIKMCGYKGCHGDGLIQCENCDTWFCDDHGSIGGDIVQEGYADGYCRRI